MKKILITGCAGFIGFHLSNKLKDIYTVDGIDNLNDYYDINLKLKRLKILGNGINFFKIDLKNKKDLIKFFSNKKYDLIIHLAAQAGVRYSFDHPDTYIENNIIGTYNLLEILKNNKDTKIIFASTSSVYGQTLKTDPFEENQDTNKPLSLYASTKKSCEVILHNYSINFDLSITVLRFFTVYGPWGRPDMALFKFIKNISQDIPIDVYNKGEMYRDFTYVDDLVNSISLFIYKLFKLSKEESLVNYDIINVGNQNSVKLMDFITHIEQIMKKKAKINFLPIQPGDVPFTLSNSQKLKNIINYVPSTSYKDGIANFYEWYKENYFIN